MLYILELSRINKYYVWLSISSALGDLAIDRRKNKTAESEIVRDREDSSLDSAKAHARVLQLSACVRCVRYWYTTLIIVLVVIQRVLWSFFPAQMLPVRLPRMGSRCIRKSVRAIQSVWASIDAYCTASVGGIS